MVVRDLDLESVALTPNEANPPLVVDPDAVLAPAVTRQLLQTVTRRDLQIPQDIGSFQDPEIDVGPSLNIWRQASACLPDIYLFGPLILE